jgi:hypothetical protein
LRGGGKRRIANGSEVEGKECVGSGLVKDNFFRKKKWIQFPRNVQFYCIYILGLK